MLIVNTYALKWRAERFFRDLTPILTNFLDFRLIWGRDFNVLVDPGRDRRGGGATFAAGEASRT